MKRAWAVRRLRHRFWTRMASPDPYARRRRILVKLGRCPGCGMKRPCQLDIESDMYLASLRKPAEGNQ